MNVANIAVFFYFFPSQMTFISQFESVCCFNHGIVLCSDMLCNVHPYTYPLAHIYGRFLTGIIMKNEDTAPMAQLDLLLKSEGSEKDQCFAVGILAFQEPRNPFHWLRNIQTMLVGLACSQMLLLNIFLWSLALFFFFFKAINVFRFFPA